MMRRKMVSYSNGSLNHHKVGRPIVVVASTVGKYFVFIMFLILLVLFRFISNLVVPDSVSHHPSQNHETQLRSNRNHKINIHSITVTKVTKNPTTEKVVDPNKDREIESIVVADTDNNDHSLDKVIPPIVPDVSTNVVEADNHAEGISTSLVSNTDSATTEMTDTTSSWHVTIAHEPRYDLLGSFVLPTILLLGVAQWEHWNLLILPFYGSPQHAILTDLFAQKGNLTKDWGSGFQDASHRADYNPMELNDMSYETMGFFPEVAKDIEIRNKLPWIPCDKIPKTEKELNQICGEENKKRNINDKNCYILLNDNPNRISDYIRGKGGMDQFFSRTFCEQIRAQFLLKNYHRLQQYGITNTTENGGTIFNVAVHIRRGDILNPDRWIDQHVFANVAKHICQTNTKKNENIQTNIHVFSSGPNRDGNWSMMERLAQPTDADGNDKNNNNITIPPVCSKVYIHLDEVEFDTWTFMIAADALVISPSTFGYVPSLIRYNNVYYPRKFWHPVLSSFTIFDDSNGRIISQGKES